jgi:glycosyltransferase involved in cell wall biosynthesis
VVTVYDMIFERFAVKHGDRTTAPKRAAVERADHVICISENTRRDLIEILGVPEQKTSVVYLAADRAFQQEGSDDEPWAGPEKPFLLHVGGRQNYKNFRSFIEAFGTSPYLKNNFGIVCFGGGPLTDDELAHAAHLEIDSSRLMYRTGGDLILAAYYRKAAALIYPSLYEGFGIPPIEAMACSCPVICSRTSSLPEVVGDAGEYFDPKSREEMVGAMERVLQSSTRRDELIQRGKARSQMFSWDQCARETLEVYKHLL